MSSKPAKQPKDDEESSQRQPRFKISAVYAAFGFLTAVVGFVFLVDPTLRPDPRERQEASLETVAVDQGVSFRAYAERVGEGQSQAVRNARSDACIPGNVVYLKIALAGFKDRETTLRYLTFSAATRTRVRGVVNIPGAGLRISGEVPSDQSVSLQWVQWPHVRKAATFFNRFELSQGENLLAVADTKPFKVDQDSYQAAWERCERLRRHGKTSEWPPSPGIQEYSLSTGGRGFDTPRWLIYAFALGAAGVIGAGIYSLIGRLRSRDSAA